MVEPVAAFAVVPVLPVEPISDIAPFEIDFVVALFDLDAHIDTGSTVEELLDCFVLHG